MKWFEVLLYDTMIQFNTIIFCKALNVFKHNKWLNTSIWRIDGTLTGTTTLDQSVPSSNENKTLLHILQRPWSGAFSSDVCHVPENLWKGLP